MQDPTFVIFTGSMFSGKTSKLLAALDRAKYQNKKIVVFKPKIDNRYAKSDIVTHTGSRWPAIAISAGHEMIDWVQDANVVAVDEAFMIEGIAECLISLFKQGKTILVSSIQLSATGKVFEEVRDMMPWATKIDVCPAVCPETGKDAYYTIRKIASLDELASELEVGGSNVYLPACWEKAQFIHEEQ